MYLQNFNFRYRRNRKLILPKYGNSYTLPTSALIYPTLDYKNKFHMDHIFPKSLFIMSKLSEKDSDNIEFYLENVNLIAKLQLIEGPVNEEKNLIQNSKIGLTRFTLKKIKERHIWKRNLYPTLIYPFEIFEEFIIERKDLM